MYVNRLPIDDGSAHGSPTGNAPHSNGWRWHCSIYRDTLVNVTVDAKDHGIIAITQPRRVFGNGTHHGLKIGG
jgi:hypothetical protein